MNHDRGASQRELESANEGDLLKELRFFHAVLLVCPVADHRDSNANKKRDEGHHDDKFEQRKHNAEDDDEPFKNGEADQNRCRQNCPATKS